MLKVEKTNVTGWEAAIRGMRNPYNSWAKSDSHICPRSENFVDCKTDTEECPRHGDFKEDVFCIGKNDMELMQKLVKAGDCHAKFARMIVVTADVTAPRYWWPEFDQYKVGTVTDSCSTMHTIMKNPLKPEDFSMDGATATSSEILTEVLDALNDCIYQYKKLKGAELKEAREIYFRSVIAMLPQSYNQKRTIQVSYQSLRNMYIWRKTHPLTEWHQFCDWIEGLPYSDLITLCHR